MTARFKEAQALRVSNRATLSWDLLKIRETFDDYVIPHILSIPIGPCQSKDLLVWHYDRRGKYTVKSGYYIAKQLHDDQHRKAGPEPLATMVYPISGKKSGPTPCHRKYPSSYGVCYKKSYLPTLQSILAFITSPRTAFFVEPKNPCAAFSLTVLELCAFGLVLPWV